MSQTSTNQQPREYQFKSDPQGSWELNIDNEFPAGAHVITVEDEKGNVDQAMMYVVKDTSATQVQPAVTVIDRVKTFVPGYIGLALLLLALCIIILSAYLLRVSSTADKLELQIQTQKKHRFIVKALLLSILAFILLALAGLYVNRTSNFVSKIFTEKPSNAVIGEVSGQILSPLTSAGVGGVDLVSADTSIRTSGSGSFIFSNAKQSDGIKLTYSSLLRPIRIQLNAGAQSQRLTIFFEADMYNSLFRILDAESRGQYTEIYKKYLSAAIKKDVDEKAFVSSYSSVLTPNNITDQELVVVKNEVLDNYNADKYNKKFSKAVLVTASINGKNIIYPLVFENNTWVLAK